MARSFVGFGLGVVLMGVLTMPLPARAVSVGEVHRVASEPTAAARDQGHRTELRITIWYPASTDTAEAPLVIGPPAAPLFEVGTAAANARFVDDGARHPVIMLSHGFGGTARMMGWFGIAMARDGYIVIAVDHPGNNAVDAMTIAGAVLWWDRVGDLRTALDEVGRGPVIGRRLDRERVGAAGFSAGGFAALLAAGAKVDPARWIRFCRQNPDDGDCQPNEEFPASFGEQAKALNSVELAVDVARAGQDHALPRLRAVFAMAPAWVQALEPASLSGLRVPVHIVLGEADRVATPATSRGGSPDPACRGRSASRRRSLWFLATCTERGRAILPLCRGAHAQAKAHDHAIGAARTFLGGCFADRADCQYSAPAFQADGPEIQIARAGHFPSITFETT
jgi:predicted dienelactone hydrolase